MKIIDFHSHILPYMDHGSTRVETAHAQLALMQDAGVEAVVATSHFYPQRILPSEFLQKRAVSLARLLDAWGETPRPTLFLGAEVLICPGLENMEELDNLCIAGTRVMLLEMPFTAEGWDEALYTTLNAIRERDIIPVLAHVDRYPTHSVQALLDKGYRAQLNAGSLDCLFKPKQLLRWMDEGHIVAVGSDLHGADPKSYKAFTKTITSLSDRVGHIMTATADLLRDAQPY